MAFQVNTQAITAWQTWLNTNFPPGPWIPTEGFFTTTRLEFDANGNPTFNGNAGYPLKGFLNTGTGEIKYFDARRFYTIV